jgi:hypothetical protein
MSAVCFSSYLFYNAVSGQQPGTYPKGGEGGDAGLQPANKILKTDVVRHDDVKGYT